MNLLDFGIEVIALSASGVLTPGPLFFANLAYGTHHDKWSGIKIAYGHTAVELPLIIILAAGLFTFDTAKKYASVVGLIGGIAILDFAAFGVATGVAILFALHIWMDYAWLASTAYLASKGAFVLKSKYYPTLLLGLTVVLIYYGLSFVSNAASQQIYP